MEAFNNAYKNEADDKGASISAWTAIKKAGYVKNSKTKKWGKPIKKGK